jgi:hypothetical protein
MAAPRLFMDRRQILVLSLLAVLGIALCLVGWYRWLT